MSEAIFEGGPKADVLPNQQAPRTVEVQRGNWKDMLKNIVRKSPLNRSRSSSVSTAVNPQERQQIHQRSEDARRAEMRRKDALYESAKFKKGMQLARGIRQQQTLNEIREGFGRGAK